MYKRRGGSFSLHFLYLFFIISGNSLFAVDILLPADRGKISSNEYLNLTYKVKLTLPEKWQNVLLSKQMLKVRGKVVEFVNFDLNTRVIIAIEEHPKSLLITANNNLAAIRVNFYKSWVLSQYNWMKKGQNLCYFQRIKVENDDGEYFMIKNYVILKKDQENIKISFFWICPLDNYIYNRLYLENIFYRFFKVD